MTDVTDPTTEQQQAQSPYPVRPTQRPKRVMEFGIAALSIGIIAVLVLGFAGGLASQALFPRNRVQLACRVNKATKASKARSAKQVPPDRQETRPTSTCQTSATALPTTPSTTPRTVTPG